jgi:hypothetical protein
VTEYIGYYGRYSNKSRGLRKKAAAAGAVNVPPETCLAPRSHATPPEAGLYGGSPAGPPETPERDEPDDGFRKECKRAWSKLIQRVYEIDPLICPRCGTRMRVIAYIEKSPVVRKILNHLGLWDSQKRAPPHGPPLPGESYLGGLIRPRAPRVAEPEVIYDEPRASYDEPA